MKNSNNLYDNLKESDKKTILQKQYIERGLSFGSIAKEYKTYANKLRRDAIKFNIKIRDKSEAQKNAIKTGIHKHPTKGKQRSDTTKKKIGNSVMKSWDSLSENELLDRKNKSRDRWEALDAEKQNTILKLANNAVRHASKTGSKLEKYLMEKLLEDGYKVEFHKEQTLLNTKLQIDLFLSDHSIAIEVDGPSHFEPVWGKDSLKRNKKYDAKKEGLILGKGWKMIRIKQTKDFSNSRGDYIYSKLLETISTILNNSDYKTITIQDK